MRNEQRCDTLEERLKRCIKREKAKTIHRMANLARLGSKKGVFSPKGMTHETGTKYSIVYRDLRRLQELDVITRIKRGRYALKAQVREKDLEDKIAEKMMRAMMNERPQRR